MRPAPLPELVASRRTLVCCGPGGVGKTTTAAVLAMHAARLGRSAVVVTIDPAKRLANALGLDRLDNVARRVDPSMWDPDGIRRPGGELSAVMLDAKSTFDALVVKYASGPEQAARILANNFYRNISEALSGTQEYMAMEKLYELHQEGEYDLVVVDTPPTRNALDFLDAPNRLTRFLEGRVFRVLSSPVGAGMRLVNRAARVFLKAAARIIGSEVLDDVVEFFAAFEGMYDGFHERASRVRELLGDTDTAFLLVASPRRDALAEVLAFSASLEGLGYKPAGAIVNRLHPRFAASTSEATALRAQTLAARDEPAAHRLADLYENLAAFQDIASREEAHLAALCKAVAGAPIARVPFLGDDVHDFATLRSLEENLFPQQEDPSE
jgi:anion-transporting  ArsA/GET3 family ATPase